MPVTVDIQNELPALWDQNTQKAFFDSVDPQFTMFFAIGLCDKLIFLQYWLCHIQFKDVWYSKAQKMLKFTFNALIQQQ